MILFIGGIFAFPQTEIDKLMTERAPNCQDIAYNCTRLIEKYFVENKHDSVKVILDYWENKCGLSEPVLRMKILTSIRDKNFSESLYESTIFNYVNEFKYHIENNQPSNNYYYYNRGYSDFIMTNRPFDKFTKALANELIKSQKENTLEYLFCKLYSGNLDSFYDELQNPDRYNGTKLKDYYYKQVNKYVNLAGFHWALFSGVWTPFGKASLLGSHPLLGFEFGSKYRKMYLNVSMYFKFSNAVNKYTFMLEDSARITNHFFGGYFGLDFERELIKVRKNEFNILAGISWDGFDTMESNTKDDRTDNDKGKSISSLNLNVGLGYRYIFKNSAYLGIRGKYNFVNYKNVGGTDLSGHTMTITIAYGGFLNSMKSYYLKQYNYHE